MDWIQQWQSKLNKQNGVAPLVRTGGSRHTGLAALPYRNIHTRMPFVMVTLFLTFHIQFFIEFLFRLIRLDFFHCLTPAVKYLFVKTSPSSSVKPPMNNFCNILIIEKNTFIRSQIALRI